MRVWVTRTEPGASALGEVLRANGFDVFRAPVLEIRPAAFESPKGWFECAVFLSVHGVRIAAAELAGAIPTLYAVGSRTQAALRELGFDAAVPGEATSEGLLESLPDPAGKRILIVTGAGGRDLLRDTLTRRGADVTRLEVYVRYPLLPTIDAARIDIIVASSGDGFRQAAAVWLAAGGAPDVPVLVPSSRVAALGAELGLESVHDCGGAGAAAVAKTLRRLGFAKDRG